MPNPAALKPKTVSVIIPTLNEEKTIGLALEALSRQTIPPLELIVVDNGSQDETKGVVESFIERTPILNAILLIEPKKGPSAARNTGIRKARGEILAFLDADAVPNDDWIECLLTLFDPSFSGVGGPCLGFLPGHFMERYFTAVQKSNYRAHELSQEMDLRMNFLLGGNCAFRREALLEMGGFDETLTTSEDMELCQRLLSRRKRLYFDPSLAIRHASDLSILARLKRNFQAGVVQVKVLKHHFPKGVTLCGGGFFRSLKYATGAPFSAMMDPFSITKVLFFLFLAGLFSPYVSIPLWGGLIGLVAWRIHAVYRKAEMSYSLLEFLLVFIFWFLERICLDLGRLSGSLRYGVLYF